MTRKKKIKIQITPDKVDQLMTLFRNLPRQPVGNHLSDDEFVGYAAETLTEAETQRVDEHLASCPTCAEEMGKLLEISQAWHGEQGRQRLAALWQRILPRLLTTPPPPERPALTQALQQITQAWRQVMRQMTQDLEFRLRQEPGWASAAPPQAKGQVLWEWESEDRFYAHLVRQVNGDLTFRIWSRDRTDLTLEGQRVRLRCDFSGHILEREEALERKFGDQVGAEIEIPAYEQPGPLTDIWIDLANATSRSGAQS